MTKHMTNHGGESSVPPLRVIGYIRTDFPTKFGIPRQSGLAASLRGEIHFLPKYRNPDALRGITEFSHLWLLGFFRRRFAREMILFRPFVRRDSAAIRASVFLLRVRPSVRIPSDFPR